MSGKEDGISHNWHIKWHRTTGHKNNYIITPTKKKLIETLNSFTDMRTSRVSNIYKRMFIGPTGLHMFLNWFRFRCSRFPELSFLWYLWYRDFPSLRLRFVLKRVLNKQINMNIHIYDWFNTKLDQLDIFIREILNHVHLDK